VGVVSYERGAPVEAPHLSTDRWLGSSCFTRPFQKGNVQRFLERLVCEAHRLLYQSTLGMKVIEKKRRGRGYMVEVLVSIRGKHAFLTLIHAGSAATGKVAEPARECLRNPLMSASSSLLLSSLKLSDTKVNEL